MTQMFLCGMSWRVAVCALFDNKTAGGLDGRIMQVDSTEFVGYFPKMRELAKAGAVLRVEDGEKIYEFRAVGDLPPMSLEQWREANQDRFKTMGTARYDYEEGPIIPIEEWGNLA